MRSRTLAVALSIGSLIGASAYGGTFTVSLETSRLIGHAAGPFFLEFQLNDGSGTNDANNAITLSKFAFGSGVPTGLPAFIGGVTGGLGTGVSLTDSGFFNQFIQGFTPGISLTFQLSLTTNVDAGGTPDEFSFAILDSSGFEIPTLGPANALLIIDIDSSSPTAQVFASDPNTLPSGGGAGIHMNAPTVTPVPEPGTFVVVGAVLAAALAIRRFLTPALRSSGGSSS